jgi:hypothetical protein
MPDCAGHAGFGYRMHFGPPGLYDFVCQFRRQGDVKAPVPRVEVTDFAVVQQECVDWACGNCVLEPDCPRALC